MFLLLVMEQLLLSDLINSTFFTSFIGSDNIVTGTAGGQEEEQHGARKYKLAIF